MIYPTQLEPKEKTLSLKELLNRLMMVTIDLDAFPIVGKRFRLSPILPLGLVTSIAALVMAGCSGKSAPPPNPPPPEVGVVTAVQQDVPIYGNWVATLDGYVNANIQPQVSGYLIKQDYREGSLVHKGEVLFEIDPRPFQALLDQAKGQLAQAKGQLGQAQAQLGLATINVNRDTPLAKARAIAQSQLDNDIQTKAQSEALIKTNQASIESAEAAVEQAELNLGFTKVRSLVDGIAGIATTQIGNLVSPSTVLTAVSQVNPIKVYFPISEQEYLAIAGKIKSGAVVDLLRQKNPVPLELTLANGNIYPRRGTIIFADRQVNSQTGSIQIAGAFPNPGNVLRPGQFGRVSAMTNIERGAVLVPQRAVSQLQGSYQVAVIAPGNKIDLRDVKVGELAGSNWIIKSGLKPGERVVSEGVSKVKQGMAVNPRPDTSQAESPNTSQPASQ